ncbi:MAG: hypothetical protein H7X85_11210 [Thermoanaerobaculia bacterium]|nr:hypothetical protein [Thermoanaerobaculia bacterium]
MKPPSRSLAVGLLLAGFSLGLQALQTESALPGISAEGASAVAGRPPTRRELEKQIKDAESRAKRLDREAKDDERRAKSWANRAAEADAIGRTELAKRNRDISEGFAKDAARERQQAQEAREEAARLRRQLADLLAGRPIEGTVPGAPPPPPPKAAPLEPDVPGLNQPPDPPQPGDPSPGAPAEPKKDVPPVVVPPLVPTAPGPAVPPRAGCQLPEAGVTTKVETTIKSHADNHDHSFCVLFDRKVRQVRWTESRQGSFMVRFEDLPADLNCTSTSPGSCAGQCVGRLPRVAGQENVRVTVDIEYVDPRTGKFYGDLIFHFANGEFVVGFQGGDLPQAASPYPFLALAGLAFIALGLFFRRPRLRPAWRK